MDILVLLGLVGGLGLIFLFGIGLPKIGMFLSAPSAAITIGGTTMALLIATSSEKLKNIIRVFNKVLYNQDINVPETIGTLVTFAEKARREGLLALEDDTDQLTDTFLKKGLQLVVDGTDPEMVKHILETELVQIDERHSGSTDFWRNAAALAPAFGMIGTLIGLIEMLKNLSDVSTIGPALGLALITTFYGALLANLIFIPVANKLDARNDAELLIRSIMLEGILSIQSGDNPRLVEEKLKAFLSPKLQSSIGKTE